MPQKQIPSDKHIGAVTWKEINHLVKDEPWEQVTLSHNPFTEMTLPHLYLFSMGRAAISAATTSISGLTYFAEQNVFRTDWKEGRLVIDIDRYLISQTGKDRYALFKSHPMSFPYHHPQTHDPIIRSTPIEWRPMLRNVLKNRRQ